MSSWPRAIRIGILVLELCLIGTAVGTGVAYIWRGEPDFEYFYEDGKLLLTTGAVGRGQDLPDSPGYLERRDPTTLRRDWLRWYWPFIHRFCCPLGLMPWHVAGVVWITLNLAGGVLAVRWVGRELSGMPPNDWPYTQFVPVVLMTVFWLIHFRLNQVNLIVLGFMVGAFVAWQRRQSLRGGLLMGVAILLKFTPIFMLLWFALKRQWRFLAAAIATVVLFGPVADLVIFGPDQALAEYRRWYRDAVVNGSSRSLIRLENNLDHRNQGLAVTLYRLLHHTDYARRFDEEPRARRLQREPIYMNLVDWSPGVVLNIWAVLTFITFVALVWQCRRPAARTDPFRCRMEWALFMLAMVWFMPVLRRYHFVWLYPAVAMWLAHGNRCERAGVRSPAIAWVAAVWLVGMGLVYFRLARAAGITLWCVLMLGVGLWWRLHRMSRSGDPVARVFADGNPPGETGSHEAVPLAAITRPSA